MITCLQHQMLARRVSIGLKWMAKNWVSVRPYKDRKGKKNKNPLKELIWLPMKVLNLSFTQE